MAETIGNKRRRLAAPAEVSHEVDASNSLQDPRLLDNSGKLAGSSKTAIAAKSELTQSSPSPTGSLSSERDNGSEVSYSVDTGNNRTSHTTDLMLGESSHDVIKRYNTEDKHLLDAINSKSSGEAVTLLQSKVHSFTQDGLNRALISACRRGHTLLVQTLVGVGANIEHTDENGNTPLLICAEKGFLDIVRFLVSRQANVNAWNSTGNTALILSVRPAGSTDLTRFLLEQQDVDIHHVNQDGDTALNRATRFMDMDTKRLLLEKSLARTSDRGYRDVTGTSPLELAIKARDTRSLDIFLDCQWPSSSDKLKYINEALVYMFPYSPFADVQTFSDTEVTIVQRLLQYGADVNQVSAETRLISLAVEAGNFQVVELMCTHGAELDIYYGSGKQDPLCIAAKNGRRDLIELLLKHGAELGKRYYSKSALNYALRNDHTECAKLLIQHGAKMDFASALKSAVKHQRPNYMRFVFENYNHDFKDFFSQETLKARNLLISAAEKGNSDIIGQILDAGVEVNQADSSGQTPLMAAKNREVAEFLIQRGADVNQVVDKNTGNCLMSQLIYVTKYRDCEDASTVELCKFFIDNGAMVNCRSVEGKTPLMMAASQGDCVSMLEMLLDNGADVTDVDNKGNTALMHAVGSGCSMNTSYLLKFAGNRKSEINIPNNGGLTPLIISVRRRNVAIVKELTEAGADVNMKDNNENTALHHLLIKFPWDNYDVKARDHFNLQNAEDILMSLLDAGSHVNCQNNEGLSPLMLAAKKAKSSLMSPLLDAGADVNAVSKNNHSRTAISFLSDTTYLRNYNTRCIKSLLDRGASATYFRQECLFELIFDNKIHVIHKLIQCGLGPADIETSQMHSQLSRFDLPRTLSPLCSALVHGHISLARYFMDILFLTRSDLSMFASNKAMERLLIQVRQEESENFLQELSSQPMTLFNLCLVNVTAAVGSSPGREGRVDLLPLSQMMKDSLLFKSVDKHRVLSEINPEKSSTGNTFRLADDGDDHDYDINNYDDNVSDDIEDYDDVYDKDHEESDENENDDGFVYSSNNSDSDDSFAKFLNTWKST